ncbi:MAG: hypothetical protein D6809_02515 [Gammaproteobacteria bacterium]|nr:MAG: hypothetical protein D6809_02515 [Gammaproteobacteria bacterium]
MLRSGILLLAILLAACQGGGDAGDGPGGASERGRPFFYFVVHADPTSNTSELQKRWNNLSSLIASLEARDAGHHVTIMLTGPWIDWLSTQPDKQAVLAKWIQSGHQVAFHSHTHNHTFPDGYTNAQAVFGPDKYSVCLRADKNQCTLDGALDTLLTILPAGYRVTFAAIGPHGNGGTPPYWGVNDNRCNPAVDSNGDPIADEDGCIQEEWTGTLAATVPHASGAYANLTEDNRDDPKQLLGSSGCVQWGTAPSPIYYLPHAPFETESGKTEVRLDTVEAALDLAGKGDFIGIVIHPMSYVETPTSTFSGNGVAQVQAVFDALEQRGLHSMTLDEVKDADDVGGGVACK